LREAKTISVEIFGDSELVIKQLNGQYECGNDILRNYYEECKEILKTFQLVILQHIPRENNEEANKLAQSAWVIERIKKCLPSMYILLGVI
jgi:ribonuclease HI